MKNVMMLTTTAYMSERFNRNNILILESLGYHVDVVANWEFGNPIAEKELERFEIWLSHHNSEKRSITITRSPFDFRNNYRAYKECLRMVKDEHYDLIHCHTPMGGVLGRLIAHTTRTKVIYTAHGFHFFKGAPLINWILYYPAEKFLSRWTDCLITINHEDYELASKKFFARRNKFINGIGIDIRRFNSEKSDIDAIKETLGVHKDEVVFLSVGELSTRKNHKVVIEALAEIKKMREKDTSIPIVKYYICGVGRKEFEYDELIKKHNLIDEVFLLGYRNDISELCHMADAFVFPSLQEGLPVAVMEAIAAKTVVICSNIRGNKDLILDKRYLFEPNNPDDIKDKILFVLQNKHDDIIRINYENLQKFDKEVINLEMREIYNDISLN